MFKSASLFCEISGIPKDIILMLYLKTLYRYPDVGMRRTVLMLIGILLICINDFFFLNESIVKTKRNQRGCFKVQLCIIWNEFALYKKIIHQRFATGICR